MSRNRVIGYKNKLPWHISADLKFFKSKTLGQSIIVGRNTYEFLGVLPDRHIFVVTTKPEELKDITEKGLEKYPDSKVSFINNLKQIPQDSWLCGGSFLYEQLLDFCTDFHLTYIDKKYKGDSFMPWFEDNFLLKKREHVKSGVINLEFRHYVNSTLSK